MPSSSSPSVERSATWTPSLCSKRCVAACKNSVVAKLSPSTRSTLVTWSRARSERRALSSSGTSWRIRPSLPASVSARWCVDHDHHLSVVLSSFYSSSFDFAPQQNYLWQQRGFVMPMTVGAPTKEKGARKQYGAKIVEFRKPCGFPPCFTCPGWMQCALGMAMPVLEPLGNVSTPCRFSQITTSQNHA